MSANSQHPRRREDQSPTSGSWKTLLAASSEKPITRSKTVTGGRVGLLLDTSSSMEGDPLHEAKHGAHDFVREAIVRGYSVGLVSFGSYAHVLCEPTTTLETVARAIEILCANGSTNMTEALSLGSDLLNETRMPRVLCLVTDGRPDDRNSALSRATEIKANGIDIVTLGTETADKEFLAQLASRKELAQIGKTRTLKADMGRLARLLPGPSS